jgi:hypothetical protein
MEVAINNLLSTAVLVQIHHRRNLTLREVDPLSSYTFPHIQGIVVVHL